MSKICQITGKKAQIQEVLLRRGGLLDSVEDQRRWSAYD